MKSGIIMLSISILIYGVFFHFFPDKTYTAFMKSFHIFEKLLLVLLIIFIFTVLSNLFINKDKIAKYFSNSFRGYFTSLFASWLAMGPTYAWYPLLSTLKEKGIKDSVLVVFLFARGIKPIWFPLMIVFFGWKYTIIFVIVVSIFAVLQGFLYRYLFEDNI
jgi:uncharacterized membrane protein YraQ (UPF0718 family)